MTIEPIAMNIWGAGPGLLNAGIRTTLSNAFGTTSSGTVGGTGGVDKVSHPAGGSPAGFDIRQTVRDWVNGFSNEPLPKISNGRFFRRDPQMLRIHAFVKKGPNLFIDLSKYLYDTGKMAEALGLAVELNNSFDSGFCMGFLDPGFECNMGSDEFRDGFVKGQICRLKKGVATPWEVRTRNLSAAAVLMGLGHVRFSTYGISPDYPLLKWEYAIRAVAACSMAYGVVTMLTSGLLGNDSVASERLLTGGAFKFHRNPFIASMGFGGMIILSRMAAVNLASANPQPISVAVMVGGWMTFLWRFHRNTIREEEVLEKQFGEEYRTYKAKTPKYFPAFWKIFRS